MVVGYKLDHSDHDQAFTSLLQTAQKCNVKLNDDKPKYKQNEVDLFGETYTTSGHKPARSKVSAITAMSSPTRNKCSHLLAWLIICPSFHWDCQNLQSQLESCQRDQVPFSWGPEHQAAFTKMKQEISSAPVSAYYNPKEKPVYFASKSHTEAQKGYVAIEIESLAVAWAMEKFHLFLYASHFILETEQKPLEPCNSLDYSAYWSGLLPTTLQWDTFLVLQTSLQIVYHG